MSSRHDLLLELLNKYDVVSEADLLQVKWVRSRDTGLAIWTHEDSLYIPYKFLPQKPVKFVYVFSDAETSKLSAAVNIKKVWDEAVKSRGKFVTDTVTIDFKGI
jgi:hypothetical protein